MLCTSPLCHLFSKLRGNACPLRGRKWTKTIYLLLMRRYNSTPLPGPIRNIQAHLKSCWIFEKYTYKIIIYLFIRSCVYRGMAIWWSTLIVFLRDVLAAGLWYLRVCGLTGSICRTPRGVVKVIGSSSNLVHSTAIVLYFWRTFWII